MIATAQQIQKYERSGMAKEERADRMGEVTTDDLREHIEKLTRHIADMRGAIRTLEKADEEAVTVDGVGKFKRGNDLIGDYMAKVEIGLVELKRKGRK